MRTRLGFTLIELIVAMLLTAMVGGAVFRLMTNAQRIARAQFERADMQATMRAGALVLPAELRELGYDSVPGSAQVDVDLLAMSADSIAFRAVRASGVVCNLADNELTVDTARNYAALRLPTSGTDSVMLFAELDPATSSDDRWVRRELTGVGGGTCSAAAPWNGRAGLRLGLPARRQSDGAWPADSFSLGAPIRVFQPVVYRFYASGGRTWLGSYATAGGGSIQPVLGPLASSSSFAFLDSTGSATSDRSVVRSVRVTLVAQTDRPVTDGPTGRPRIQSDTLVALVTLRNALR